MLDAFNGLAKESPDQEGLGFCCRDAAGHQVKFQILVDGSRGSTVAALYVVGVNLQLRLVVGLGALGEQQRLSHHLGIGLLRMGPYNDPALKYRSEEHTSEL